MKKILIVDDDTITLKLLATQLCHHPEYTIAPFTEGFSALVECGKLPTPDLVILDIHMPSINGIEVAKILKTNTDIPFIFISADSSENVIEQVSASGALGYILKPIDAKSLVATIQVSLKRADELKAINKDRNNLEKALDREQDVAVATGIIMVLAGLGRVQAFEKLRQCARNRQCKLLDLSKRVIDGEVIEELSPGFIHSEISDT